MSWSERQVFFTPGDAITEDVPLSRCHCQLDAGVFGMGAVHAFLPSAEWWKRRLFADFLASAPDVAARWQARASLSRREKEELNRELRPIFFGRDQDGDGGIVALAKRRSAELQPVVLEQCPHFREAVAKTALERRVEQELQEGRAGYFGGQGESF